MSASGRKQTSVSYPLLNRPPRVYRRRTTAKMSLADHQIRIHGKDCRRIGPILLLDAPSGERRKDGPRRCDYGRCRRQRDTPPEWDFEHGELPYAQRARREFRQHSGPFLIVHFKIPVRGFGALANEQYGENGKGMA